MKYIVAILAFVSINGCYCQQSRTKNDNSEPPQISIKNMSLYEGVWAENPNDNAFFIIKKSRVYNIDDMKHSFPFKIEKDTMVVDYNEFLGKYVILKISSDSLIIKNEDATITRLYKRK